MKCMDIENVGSV